MDENMKTKRSKGKLGLDMLVFYTKVSELAEKLLKKMNWNDMIYLLR